MQPAIASSALAPLRTVDLALRPQKMYGNAANPLRPIGLADRPTHDFPYMPRGERRFLLHPPAQTTEAVAPLSRLRTSSSASPRSRYCCHATSCAVVVAAVTASVSGVARAAVDREYEKREFAGRIAQCELRRRQPARCLDVVRGGRDVGAHGFGTGDHGWIARKVESSCRHRIQH